jgi:hypothetical protein
MHPLRRFVAVTRPGPFASVALALAALLAAPAGAPADLIKSDPAMSYPDLAGNIDGSQTYVYDPVSQTGTFEVSNAPVLLATGPKSSDEYFVNDTSSVIRSQTLRVKLDANGNLVNDPGNSFALYGSVTVAGKSYDGLLLQGTPTRFGFQPQAAGHAPSAFDLNMTLTGGALKDLYGPDAYMSIITESASTFDGTFARSFSGEKAYTNVRAYNAPVSPNAVPEPGTLYVLIACGGAGLFYFRRHRRIAAHELAAEDDFD